ncbi:hypothetical protein AHAS_Ahas13G0210700 [Arachis hypogaea]
MDLYRKKLSWATAYIRGRFFASLRTTSLCELLHAKLGGFVESRYRILDFVTNFQRCVDFLRNKEEELDFRSFYGTPMLQTQFPEIERSAATLYTWELFYRMESYGIPCVHIIVVLVGNDISSLLETLVLKRWCKNAKNHVTSVRQVTKTGDAASRYRSRLGAFLDQCKHFAKLACLRDEDYKVFSEKMARDAIMLEVKNGLRVAPDVNPHLNGEGVVGYMIRPASGQKAPAEETFLRYQRAQRRENAAPARNWVIAELVAPVRLYFQANSFLGTLYLQNF